MSFNRSLGDIQIAGNLGVVTSLEKQIDDLALTGADFAEMLFHFHVKSAPSRRVGETKTC
jgi:hypothetical protein